MKIIAKKIVPDLQHMAVIGLTAPPDKKAAKTGTATDPFSVCVYAPCLYEDSVDDAIVYFSSNNEETLQLLQLATFAASLKCSILIRSLADMKKLAFEADVTVTRSPSGEFVIAVKGNKQYKVIVLRDARNPVKRKAQ